MSNLEEIVMKALKKDKIYFETEKTFKDFRKGNYRFDFYCPNLQGRETIIEVQGTQHYKYVGKFYKNTREFRAAQERDRRKISYCLAKGIDLYCIPYWVVPGIKSSEDIFKADYLAKTKWKNDEDWREFNKI